MRTIDSVMDGLRAKQFRAEEIAREALAHAEAENPKTNAFLTFSPERALTAARAVDQKIAAGEEPRAPGGGPRAGKGRSPARRGRARSAARTPAGCVA